MDCGSEFMISKKLLKTFLKSALVYEFIRQTPNGIAMLLLFLPKNKPRPHFFDFSP
jgi:hypothetical protein